MLLLHMFSSICKLQFKYHMVTYNLVQQPYVALERASFKVVLRVCLHRKLWKSQMKFFHAIKIKVVGVPVTLNRDLKIQFVETNVGFYTTCKDEEEDEEG